MRVERIGVTVLSSATFLSVLADTFFVVSLTWLLVVRSQGAVLGAVLATLAITRLVLMPAGGWVSDRLPRGRLLMMTSASRAILAVAVGVGAASSQLWILFILLGLLGVASAVHYPSDRAVVVDVVRDPLLGWANGWVQSLTQLGQILGAIVAGAAITLVGAQVAIMLGAAVYVAAAIVFACLRIRPHTAADPVAGDTTVDDPATKRLTTLRVLTRQRGLLPLLIVIGVFNIGFVGPFTIGLPALVDEGFGAEAYWFGIIQSGFAAGSIVGALWGSRLRGDWTGLRLVVGEFVITLGIIAGAIAPLIALTLLCFVVSGIASGLMNVGLMTLIQHATPRQYIGRVMSVVSMVTLGLAPVSQALAGAGIAAFSGQAVLVMGALFSMATVACVAPLLISALRRVNEQVTDGQ